MNARTVTARFALVALWLPLAAGCDRPSSPRGSPDAAAARANRDLQGYRALGDSELGVERFNADADEEFELLLDQGIRRTADVSDVYVHKRTRRIATGLDPEVLSSLERRLDRLLEEMRHPWIEHRMRFRADPSAKPVPEGILRERTPSVKIAMPKETVPVTRELSALASRMAELIERETDVPVTRVRMAENPWIQDFFVPFEDGILGVPPHLDQKSFHGSLIADRPNLRLGGSAFTISSSVKEPLGHLLQQGHRLRPLRAFIEGGNAVFAVAGDGRLKAVVGRNSVRLTAGFYDLDERAAKALLAGDFNMAPDDVLIVPQTDFHIDLYLRAARPGTVLVASQDEGEAMLRALLSDGPASEHRVLESLLQRVERVNDSPLGQALAKQLETTRRILRGGSFAVVDYPSLYYSYFATGEFERRGEEYMPKTDATSFIHVNTLNNRYVTTSDGRALSFTLSTGYPLIDRHLAALERKEGVDRVFYLGHRLAAPRFWGNQVLLSAGGVGCLTNL